MFDLARNDEVFVLAERHAVFGSEFFRALADKINVGTLAQNFSRGTDGIAQMLDASHSAGAQSRAVHDEGVELDPAVAIQKAAASGIERLVVFHNDDGFFDGVEGRAATVEHAPSSGESIRDTADVGIDHVLGHGPGAAVNNENGIGHRNSPSCEPRVPSFRDWLV